ncbi:MAG: hypothetical protein RLZZ352_1804 [Pseudomonadota bacterium]|jgi:hypothetical protein
MVTLGQLPKIFRHDSFYTLTGAACIVALARPMLPPLTN